MVRLGGIDCLGWGKEEITIFKKGQEQKQKQDGNPKVNRKGGRKACCQELSRLCISLRVLAVLCLLVYVFVYVCIKSVYRMFKF